MHCTNRNTVELDQVPQSQSFSSDYSVQPNNNTYPQNTKFCGAFRGRYGHSISGRGHNGGSSI